jgi:hypothetical protein
MSKDNLVRKLLQQRNAIEDKLIAQDSSMLSVPELLMKHKALSRRYKSSKTNFTDQITDAQKRMMDQIDEIEKMVQRINLSHFKPNAKINAGDEELVKYANDFLDLAPEEQKNLFIGDGAFKDAFDIPGTGLVIKKAGGKFGSDEGIIKDYLSNKVMEDSFTYGAKDDSVKALDPDWKKSLLERPKLVIIPERDPVLIQKKLIKLATPFERKLEIHPANLQEDYLREIDDNLLEGFHPQDLHSGNIGIDPVTHKAKAFDAMVSEKAYPKVVEVSPKFKKIINSLTDPKVFRAIAPLAPVAKTLGKVGLPLAAAYSNYSEAKEEGLPTPLAVAYAGAEELNPTPISGIDFYKGMEKAGEGRRKNMEANYKSSETMAEQKALENYANSPAAKDKAFSKLRELINGYMLDENVPRKKIKKSYFNPETEEYEYEYE